VKSVKEKDKTLKIVKNTAFILTFLTILIVPLSSTFALQTNYSAKFEFTYDFSEDNLNTNLSTEFRINANAFGSGYDLSFSLKDTSLESAKLVIKNDAFKLSLYDNTTYGSTQDPIVLYKINSGQNGLEVEIYPIFPVKLTFFNTLNLMHAQMNFPDTLLIIGKRDNLFDAAIYYNKTFGSVNFKSEIAAQDLTHFNVKNSLLYTQISENNYRWGGTYILAGASDTSFSYSSQVINQQNMVNLWHRFGSSPSFNTYINTHFNFATLPSDLDKNTEVGLDVNFGQIYLNVKKTGVSNVTGFTPDRWGNFYFAFGSKFSLFDFSGNLGYAFGKPIHNSINTLGELFYLDVSKNFGNISLFSKYQKVIGYYEEKDFFYSEIKFTGFANGEVALRIGDGDFERKDAFKPVGGVYFSLWW
jgi:hypothetical protein